MYFVFFLITEECNLNQKSLSFQKVDVKLSSREIFCDANMGKLEAMKRLMDCRNLRFKKLWINKRCNEELRRNIKIWIKLLWSKGIENHLLPAARHSKYMLN